MQRVQRKFGKLLKRSANEADVEDVLKEFYEADNTLTNFISATKSWRDAWDETLRTQLYAAETFHTLYEPIEVEEDPENPVNRGPSPPTPRQYLDKARDLEIVYTNLLNDLGNEVNSIELKIIGPATELRNLLKSLKKTIKKREDCKLDYERYNSRADSVRRKDGRSEREEHALMKHEDNLARATSAYQAADDQLKKALPPVLEGISMLVPDLLAIQIMIQHSLVGQLYTILHEYCQHHRLPSPSPSMDAVISTFETEYTPLREEVESNFKVLSGGRAVHQPMSLPDKPQGSITGLGIRSTLVHRKSSQNSLPKFGGFGGHGGSSPQPQKAVEFDERDEGPAPVKPPRPGGGGGGGGGGDGGASSLDPSSKPRIPSSSKLTSSAMAAYTPGGATPSPYSANGSAAASPYLTPSAPRANNDADYFSRDRKPSASSMASSIAAKKKAPPPPPKPKRLPSAQSQFVTALYDFTGQNQGDLSFQEGDRIKVVKKTESTDDWWEGEVRGMAGSFPANYVQIG